MLFQHQVDINRFTAVGTNGRRTLSLLYQSVTCLVIPMSAQATVTHNMTLGRAFDVYFPAGQDVRASDQIIYNGGKYTVQGVQSYDVPSVGHIHAVCQQEIT